MNDRYFFTNLLDRMIKGDAANIDITNLPCLWFLKTIYRHCLWKYVAAARHQCKNDIRKRSKGWP